MVESHRKERMRAVGQRPYTDEEVVGEMQSKAQLARLGTRNEYDRDVFTSKYVPSVRRERSKSLGAAV